jgi:hypothetical protein
MFRGGPSWRSAAMASEPEDDSKHKTTPQRFMTLQGASRRVTIPPKRQSHTCSGSCRSRTVVLCCATDAGANILGLVESFDNHVIRHLPTCEAWDTANYHLAILRGEARSAWTPVKFNLATRCRTNLFIQTSSPAR